MTVNDALRPQGAAFLRSRGAVWSIYGISDRRLRPRRINAERYSADVSIIH